MSNKESSEQNEVTEDDLLQLLFSKDETGIVLKVHLYVEQKLDELIDIIFPNSDYILRQTFAQKVNILNSMGALGERNYNAFITINKIRNKFSHKFGYSLSEKDLNELKQICKLDNKSTPDELKKHSFSENLFILGLVAADFKGRLEYLAEISGELNPLSTISLKKFTEEYERNVLSKDARDPIKPEPEDS